jgi:hypothetical protein
MKDKFELTVKKALSMFFYDFFDKVIKFFVWSTTKLPVVWETSHVIWQGVIRNADDIPCVQIQLIDSSAFTRT